MTKDKKTKGPTEVTKTPEVLGDILEDLNSYLKKNIYMPSLDRKLNIIFLAYSYIWDRFNYAVYILLHSAEKRCGKSSMIDHMAELVPSQLKTSGGTSAAYLRAISVEKPVLFVDELDKTVKQDATADAELLQILNSGFKRNNPIIKSIPKGKKGIFDVEELDPFCPKVLGMIGGHQLDDTTRDRAIMIQMHRVSHAQREMFGIYDDLDDIFEKYEPVRKDIRQRLEAWSSATTCDKNKIQKPSWVQNDRSFNSHAMLLKVAIEGGKEWEKVIEDSLRRVEEQEELYIPNNQQLMIDLKKAFEQNNVSESDELKLTELTVWLQDDEFIESPWRHYPRDPISVRSLKKLLTPYGIFEKRTNSKRYWLAKDFMDLFKTYVDGDGELSQLSLTSQNDTNATDTDQLGEVTPMTEVTDSKNKPVITSRYDKLATQGRSVQEVENDI